MSTKGLMFVVSFFHVICKISNAIDAPVSISAKSIWKHDPAPGPPFFGTPANI